MIFGFLAFLSFESKFSKCTVHRVTTGKVLCETGQRLTYTTPEQITTEFLIRVAVVLVMAGGILFLLGRRADEKVSLGTVWKSVKGKIWLLYPYILVFIGVILVSFLVLGIVYQKNQPKFTRPLPSPSTGGTLIPFPK